MWDDLDPEIVNVARPRADNGDYDGAIFEAMKVIETSIQSRIGSTSIGRELLKQAFDGVPPLILISHNPLDQQGAKDLFVGAFSVRGDRAHGKVPAVLTETIDACFLYLWFASFLLYLLSRDQNALPQIQALRVSALPDQPRVEIIGDNFGIHSRVEANGEPAVIVRRADSLLEIVVPLGFAGEICVIAPDRFGEKRSIPRYCSTHSPREQPPNLYEVISSEVPLYSDIACTQRRDNVVGLLLRATEAGHEFTRITPVYPGAYTAGVYVSHGPVGADHVGETWYRDPVTGEIQPGWSGTLVSAPTIICRPEDLKLGNLVILPTPARMQVEEHRALRAVGTFDGGPTFPLWREVDLTTEVQWTTVDRHIVNVRKGSVHPRRFGSATVQASNAGFLARADITVGHYLRGEQVTYFQGLRRLQEIRFDADDDLYICNQSGSVYSLSRAGEFCEVVRVASLEPEAYGISSIAVDQARNLYANDLKRRACLYFPRSGDTYESPRIFATIVEGVKQGIAVDSEGYKFVAVMDKPGTGFIIVVDPTGSETFFPTRDMPIHVCVDPDGYVCTPSRRDRAIHKYDRAGTLIESVVHGVDDAVSDIAVDTEGNFYLGFFQQGCVVKVSRRGTNPVLHTVATGLTNVGGVALDSRERVYVSDFGGSCIYVVY